MVNLFGVYHYCYTGAGVLAGVYCTSGRSVKLPKPLGPLEMDLAESVIGRWGILCPVSIAKIYLVTTINITLMLAFQEFIGSQGKWIQFETRSYYALPWTLFATWTYAYSGSKTGMGTRRDYPCSIGMLVVLAGIVLNHDWMDPHTHRWEKWDIFVLPLWCFLHCITCARAIMNTLSYLSREHPYE
mmetsp:Transcript_35584/g.55570  ORF Transcript_35584/g.55570 Transcript_35584/m.55570 type:complete len:186 (-) Transcript_35584:191-748(-)